MGGCCLAGKGIGRCDDLRAVIAGDIHVQHMSESGVVFLSDFEIARMAMVESQLRTNGVLDGRVLSAFMSVPREEFVPASRRAVAYIDGFQPLEDAPNPRQMGAPAALGRLLQLAEVREEDSVLDIGAGLGYSTAILSLLAKTVIGVEPNPVLAAQASQNLAKLGFGNARVIESEQSLPEQGKFDVIHVGWSLTEVPTTLLARLNPGGRLVAVINSGGIGVANIYVCAEGSVAARAEFDANLPQGPHLALIQDFVF